MICNEFTAIKVTSTYRNHAFANFVHVRLWWDDSHTIRRIVIGQNFRFELWVIYFFTKM